MLCPFHCYSTLTIIVSLSHFVVSIVITFRRFHPHAGIWSQSSVVECLHCLPGSFPAMPAALNALACAVFLCLQLCIHSANKILAPSLLSWHISTQVRLVLPFFVSAGYLAIAAAIAKRSWYFSSALPYFATKVAKDMYYCRRHTGPFKQSNHPGGGHSVPEVENFNSAI